MFIYLFFFVPLAYVDETMLTSIAVVPRPLYFFAPELPAHIVPSELRT